MKEFLNKIKTGISQYFKSFSKNTREYLKINSIALLIIFSVLLILTVWLWPSEKKIDQQVYSKNTELARNYDEQTNTYKNEEKAAQLQIQINEIQSSKQKYRLFKILFYSVILTVLTGLLATLLQAVYTKLKFTNDLESSQRVLSAALFSSAFIVCTAFIIIYFPLL